MKTKEMCSGCYNNEYNYGLGGSKECFSYESAKPVKKLAVSVDQMPPFDKKKARTFLSCYHQQRMCHVSPDAITEQGYWK